MWRGVAPELAADFTVVCADLRGYGASSCPPSQPDHAPYTKRAMAEDMVSLMEHLGFPSFSVAGHDRGGRVAYRLALDHPARIERCAVLDVVTVADAWDRADRRFTLGYWPWSLLAQPAPLPERLLFAAKHLGAVSKAAVWVSSLTIEPLLRTLVALWHGSTREAADGLRAYGHLLRWIAMGTRLR